LCKEERTRKTCGRGDEDRKSNSKSSPNAFQVFADRSCRGKEQEGNFAVKPSLFIQYAELSSKTSEGLVSFASSISSNPGKSKGMNEIQWFCCAAGDREQPIQMDSNYSKCIEKMDH
jgi:hypothetical protein